MFTKEVCIKHIDDTTNSISGIDAAYVARIRLRPVILACNRMVARQYGLPLPILPGRLEVPPTTSKHIVDITDCCSRLSEYAHILSQPSEPLDHRWRSNWAEVLGTLERLRELVATLDDTQ
jgi:hypothetical protein